MECGKHKKNKIKIKKAKKSNFLALKYIYKLY